MDPDAADLVRLAHWLGRAWLGEDLQFVIGQQTMPATEVIGFVPQAVVFEHQLADFLVEWSFWRLMVSA